MPPVSTASTQAPVADYRYIITKTLSDPLGDSVVVAELPFVDVSFDSRLNEAGQFQGSFPITEEKSVIEIYEATTPGKNSLYVLRDGVCVWGGIIASRSYDIKEKILDITADEFVSYLDRRVVWKNWSTEYACDIEVFAYVVDIPDEENAPRIGVVTLRGDVDVTALNVIAGKSKMRIWFGSKTEEDVETNKHDYDGYYTILGPDNLEAAFLPRLDEKQFYFAAYYKPVKGRNYRPIKIGKYAAEGGGAAKFQQETDDYLTTLLQEHFANDLSDLGFNDERNIPGRVDRLEVVSYSRTNNIATITTTDEHFYVPGQIVEVVDIPGFRASTAEVISTPSANTFTYASTGNSLSTVQASGTNLTVDIVQWQRIGNQGVFYTSEPHGLEVGDIVRLDGVDNRIDSRDTHRVNRVGTSQNPLIDTIFQIENPGTKINLSKSTATATRVALVQSTSAGSFTANSDIGMTFQRDTDLSTVMADQDSLLGSQLFTFKEVIDKYANDLIGFDYRVDCSFDQESNVFSKEFKFLPLVPKTLQDYVKNAGGTIPADLLPEIKYFSVEGRNAADISFEYPGNIESVGFTETIEEGATRIFVQGAGTTGGPKLYSFSAAADRDALLDDWPLFDKVIKKDKLSDTADLFGIAKTIRSQAQLPVATFTITVNGSLNPQVGTYKPGDWCIVRIDDPFISQRLDSYYENKGDATRQVFLRKITSISVQLSNNPTLPEIVSLELVTEPGIDVTGEERNWREAGLLAPEIEV